ncbi:hopene-associated glycosyltransferase HpnB [Nitrosomonas sp. PY1]|uniref:glycosyltransferase n=1 Tax=Nitrosomonas sp. PY1 TaxID=1803906 RepID=UPI001FC86325|nr:glycosyltransferase [Nitrosomonas sp. PY1]GKS69874.1 hopene-associated glycosyltransferase HpnB [Nitrosomonas sp. PY1]
MLEVLELVEYLAIFGVVCWYAVIFLPWRPCEVREKLECPVSVDEPPITDPPVTDITVLIPARDEGLYIQRTLAGVKQQSVKTQIIVIDDQSSDDTAEQALACNAQVISGTSPPPGWSGKLWALQQGLQHVKTPFTLLLDADIELAPGIVAELHKKALAENLSLVSLMAEPPMMNFIERLLMPAFIFFFKLLYPFNLANKMTSPIAAAAGGCILIKTETLHAINAFSSLHTALIDDCTLAAYVKRTGERTWIGLSHAARSHRGYSGLMQIWNMVARTAFTQLRYSSVLLILCTFIMIAMFWIGPMAFLFSSTQLLLLIGMFSWIAMFFAYIHTLVYYQRSILWVLALPLIGTLYLAMTWTSVLRYWNGERAHWKDRRYESKANN